MQNVHFSPPEIAPLFDVNVSTVKRWIDRGLMQSEKTSGGHRRVHREQLMQFIRSMPKGAQRSYVLRRLVTSSSTDAPDKVLMEYKKKLQHRPEEARAILDRLVVQQWSMATIIDQVIAPTLRWIGAEWQARRMSIYEEHRLSFHIRSHLLHLDDLLPRGDGRRVALLVCPSGERHELPLQMLSLVARQLGWQPEVLGVNVPVLELEKAIKHLRANVVLLSATYRQPAVEKYLQAATRAAHRNRAIVLFGGAGWPATTAYSTRQRIYTTSASEVATALVNLKG